MNNVTFTAVLVALLAATNGVLVLLAGPHERLHRSFAVLCATVFMANLGLTMATIHEVRVWHVIHMLAAISSAPAAVYFFLHLLGKPQPRGASLRPLLLPLGTALSLLVIFAYDPIQLPPDQAVPGLLALFNDFVFPGPGAPPYSFGWLVANVLRQLITGSSTHAVALLTGSYIFGTYGLVLLNIVDRRQRTKSRLERARLTWLIWLGLFTVVGNFLQAMRPYIMQPVATYPIGGLAQLLFIAFLAQAILLYRLLDLHEILSRGLIFVAQVLIIGGVYSFLLALFGDARNYVNLAITIFLASGVVSLLHDPLRALIQRSIQRVVLNRRFQLMVRLNALERELPRILSIEPLFDALMTGLTEVPRITHAAIFLWDERTKDYTCQRRAGPEGWPPPFTVSGASPFARELSLRSKAFGQEDLVRELESAVEHRVELSAALAMLRKLDAEIAVPFTGDGLLFGFLLIKDDSMHEGFTRDELDLLQQLADRASVIIQNSDAIQRMKERDRLAALGQMATGLAHEIRNPLGAIRGAAQYLVEDAGPGVDHEFLDIIMEEVDRLNKVVSEFLDYSRPLKIRLEESDLNRLVAQVAQLIEAQGLPPGVVLKLDLDPGLPPAPVDMEKLKQVLLNLFQNALQAMPAGGTLTVETRPAPRVAWAGTRRGEATLERVEIRVIDTGVGIGPEHLEKLFIPFYTTKAGGTGLGLAISQRLVQAHEGEIEVESTPGGGSRFTVRLPLFQATPVLTAGESAIV